MAEQKQISPENYGLRVLGMVTNVKATAKGFILSVSLGESQAKIFSKENGLEFGQHYHALCNMGNDGPMLFERVRLALA